MYQFQMEVKSEPMDYCPVNEMKKEVLSELFDCEPDLLLNPEPSQEMLLPHTPMIMPSAGDNLMLSSHTQNDLLQVNKE